MLTAVEKIGDELIKASAINEPQWAKARSLAEQSDQEIRVVLDRLGLVAQEAWAQAAARALGVRFVDLAKHGRAPVLHDHLTTEFLQANNIAVLGEDETRIVIAMADPSDQFALDAIGLALDKKVVAYVAVQRDIEARLSVAIGAQSADPDASSVSTTDDFEKLRNLASDAPVVRYVDGLIALALKRRASDIHIEPYEKTVSVRLRIDGVLNAVAPPSFTAAPAVISRIKILAGLDIAERRLPQDGRARLRLDGREVDLRIATGPCVHGESIVMRVLASDQRKPDFQGLGFDASARERIDAAIGAANGIVLVTGPTGSGKTTTLYAAIDQLNDGLSKIVAVEDPVEYQLDGVVQIPVQPAFGRTFASSLRSILRHDPDIVMVGEMRDEETARIAMQAALTGHLVLSTLHTNDAPSAMVRLRDMCLAPYLIASTVRAVIAQRLTRRLCENCKKPIDASFLKDSALGPFLPPDAQFFAPVGCEACDGRGFKGRIAVCEVMTATPALTAFIGDGADGATLRREAIKSGMTPLVLDAFAKAGGGFIALEDALAFAQEVEDVVPV